ncbi:MAG: hypothetical protein SPI97_00870, partial [Oscillospiraceae bacterium]|nr:hypothetical protein [Oscillospiraceae bacterium]
MSAFKKVISLVLCFAMLLGTVAVAGDLLAPKATAAEGTSSVKTYAELKAQYNNFIYMGTDAYETVDGELVLSDGYVQPGDTITMRLYIKSDRYLGPMKTYQVADSHFFDVKSITGVPGTGTNGYTTNQTTTYNPDHPMTVSHGISLIMTTSNANSVAWIKAVCGMDEADRLNMETIMFATETDLNSELGEQCLRMNSDLWFGEFYLKVKDGLADGTTGTIRNEIRLWKLSENSATGAYPDKKKLGDMASLPAPATDDAWDTSVDETSTQGMYYQYQSIEAFLYDDLTHTFTIGENPNDTPVEPPVVVKSSIKTYAELKAQYN